MKLLNKKLWLWILYPAIILTLFISGSNHVDARPREAITLLYFRGFGLDNAVLLEWATATEFETAGFVIDRANSQNGPYSEQIGFIPAEGSGVEGAEYQAIDNVNVVNGQTYWYILAEIEVDGDRNETDPISVTAGLPTATPTQTSVPTAQSTSGSQATSTATPSRTPTVTSTTQSNQSATSSPTNTPAAQQTADQSGSNGQTGGSNSQGNTSTGNTGVAEASSSTNPYPDPQQTPSPTFLPDPAQANEPLSEPYPAQEGEGVENEGYPAGTALEPEINPEFTPNVQPFDENNPRGFSTQPPLNQQTPPDETTEPGSSNTLFLWIGFTAAFLIFVGGVIGSIFLFTRRSNQK